MRPCFVFCLHLSECRSISHNAIPASFFKSIRAPPGTNDRPEDESERGLRVSDRGFLNTAVIESSITYIDGDNGVLRYRCVMLLPITCAIPHQLPS